jgi:glycosyltransferase involved in cell wall biosynthesis
MPDILVFCAAVPKLIGAKVILDLHDPMPELMQTIFGLSPSSKAMRLIKWLEKISIGFSDTTLTVNEACKRLFSGRSCRSSKIQVIMNSPDEKMFAAPPSSPTPISSRAAESPFIIMYHGSLVERHGLDLAVAALGQLREGIPGIRLRVYGRRTKYLDDVLAKANESGLSPFVQYMGQKELEEIVTEIRACDLGIIPNRKSAFTHINTPTRIFEYLSQDKPVLAPNSAGILDYFGLDDLFFFELGDATDLARQIHRIYSNPSLAQTTIARGQEVLRRHSWSCEQKRFLDVASRLLFGQPNKGQPELISMKPRDLSP